jgi:hypothetical protein
MSNGEFKQQEKQKEALSKFSYWYVTNKVLLRRILIGAIISIGSIFWLYALWGLFDYFILDWSKNKQAIQQLVASRVFTQEWINRNRPQQISIGTARVFSSDGKYDFLAEVSNPAEVYWAEFDYHFTFSNGSTSGSTNFILPNEEKWVSQLAFSNGGRPSKARLVIDNIAWRRVDRAKVPDYQQWRDERLNISITDVEHEENIALEEGVYDRTSFNVQNLSAYGYYEVGFHVIAYRGSTPIGINYVVLKNLRTGDRRQVEVSWFDTLPQVSKIEVRPEVNIFDKGNYMPL